MSPEQILHVHTLMLLHLRLGIAGSITAGDRSQPAIVRSWARENAQRHYPEALRLARILQESGVEPT